MVFCALILSGFPCLSAEVPFLTGRVNDYANILSAGTSNMLSDSLKAHEMRTSNQIAVLTVTTLNGEVIEDYAYRVFNEWALGQQGKDNGVLLLVVPGDRSMRIEVGYGLESLLTDLAANRIIQNIMAPRFRQEDYNGGITDGIITIIGILEGNEMVTDMVSGYHFQVEEGNGFFDFKPDLTLWESILIGLFVFFILGLFSVIGVLTPGFGWFVYVFMIPFWAMFPMAVFGSKAGIICLAAYLVLFPVSKFLIRNTDMYKHAKNNYREGGSVFGGSGFSSGSSGSSWSSGSSSGSGSSGSRSFSGGGGRSGGGGASGGW